MKKIFRNFSIVFLILLSACSASRQQDITPTIIASKLPTEPISSAIPTVTKIIQTPTEDSAALLRKLLPNCGSAEFSPNQTWAAGFPCNNDETWIVDVKQTEKWSISYGEYYGMKFDSGNGVIAAHYWTSDNKYVYLTIQRGASGPIYFANDWGLVKLDLASGDITEVLSPIPHKTYAFSLSPDEKSLAYILQPSTPLTVNISMLENSNSRSYALNPEYNQAGEILWSPDRRKIVLGQAIIDYEETKPNIFSVVMINLADNSSEILVSDNPVQMTPKEWIDENRLELSDSDGKTWIYNLTDKTLSEKTQ